MLHHIGRGHSDFGKDGCEDWAKLINVIVPERGEYNDA